MALWHLLVSNAPSAVTLPICRAGGIWSRSSGSMGASLTSLVVNSAARNSNVFSSIPMWGLRPTRHLPIQTSRLWDWSVSLEDFPDASVSIRIGLKEGGIFVRGPYGGDFHAFAAKARRFAES